MGWACSDSLYFHVSTRCKHGVPTYPHHIHWSSATCFRKLSDWHWLISIQRSLRLMHIRIIRLSCTRRLVEKEGWPPTKSLPLPENPYPVDPNDTVWHHIYNSKWLMMTDTVDNATSPCWSQIYTITSSAIQTCLLLNMGKLQINLSTTTLI